MTPSPDLVPGNRRRPAAAREEGVGDPGMEFERRGGEERRGERKRARRPWRSRGPPPQAGRQRRRPPEAANGGGLDGGGGIAPESPGRATRRASIDLGCPYKRWKNLILILINCMWICNSKYVGPQDFCTGPWFLLLPGRSCCAAPGKLKVQKNRVYMKSCKP